MRKSRFLERKEIGTVQARVSTETVARLSLYVQNYVLVDGIHDRLDNGPVYDMRGVGLPISISALKVSDNEEKFVKACQLLLVI